MLIDVLSWSYGNLKHLRFQVWTLGCNSWSHRLRACPRDSHSLATLWSIPANISWPPPGPSKKDVKILISPPEMGGCLGGEFSGSTHRFIPWMELWGTGRAQRAAENFHLARYWFRGRQTPLEMVGKRCTDTMMLRGIPRKHASATKMMGQEHQTMHFSRGWPIILVDVTHHTFTHVVVAAPSKTTIWFPSEAQGMDSAVHAVELTTSQPAQSGLWRLKALITN